MSWQPKGLLFNTPRQSTVAPNGIHSLWKGCNGNPDLWLGLWQAEGSLNRKFGFSGVKLGLAISNLGLTSLSSIWQPLTVCTGEKRCQHCKNYLDDRSALLSSLENNAFRVDIGWNNGCLRRLLKIFWPVKISNENLHEITNSTNMRAILKKYRWRWIGHVLRKPTNNITRVSLRWTPEGKRKQGRPKTTWRRTVESEMKEMDQAWSELDMKVKDREQWRKLFLALCASGSNKD